MTKHITEASWSRQRSEYEAAAIQVLRQSKKPLSLRELVEAMISQKLITVRGKTPEKSLYALILRKDKRRIERGEKPLFLKLSDGKNTKFLLSKK